MKVKIGVVGLGIRGHGLMKVVVEVVIVMGDVDGGMYI